MNKDFYLSAKYVYISIGSFATIAILIIFLLVSSSSKAIDQTDGNQKPSPSSDIPVLIEKTVAFAPGVSTKVSPESRVGVSSIEPVTIAHTVKEGDSLAAVAKKYKADPQTIIDYPNNNIGDDLTLKVGSVIIVPAGIIDNPKLAQIPEPAPSIGTTPSQTELDNNPRPNISSLGIFEWPVYGSINQYAFWWHAGAIDIGLNTGDPVKSAKGGVVIEATEFKTGYGIHAVIDHGNGLSAIYAHLSRLDVKAGDHVAAGQVIGLGGSTGRSTGPHLHFEVKKDGVPVDPMTILKN